MPEQPLDYFLADKPGAELTHSLIAEASQTLRRNCNEYLATLGNEQIISKLAEVANLWRSPDYPLRQMALDADPEETGFPREVLAAGLDACFADWTQEKFFMLLTQEFGAPTRLQSFASQPNRTYSMVNGPQLIAHIAPGNLPVPVFQSIAFGLLLRSAQFVKCASGKSLLPRLFGHSLHFVEPGMAAALEIAEWDGGNESLESALFAEADCVHAGDHFTSRRRCRRVEPARLPVAARDLRGGKRQPQPGALRRNARRGTRGAKRDHAARADLDEGVGGDLDGPALLQNPRSQQRRCDTLGERGLDRLDGSARG